MESYDGFGKIIFRGFGLIYITTRLYHKLWIYELPTAERGCLLGSREAGGSKTYKLWAPTLAASMPLDLLCSGSLLSMITLESAFLYGHRLQQLKTSSLSGFIVLTQLCLTERLWISVFSCIYVHTSFTTDNKWDLVYNIMYMILLKQFLEGNIY